MKYGIAEAIAAMLDDPRVTVIGLHMEGISDLPGFDGSARAALDRGVPLVALKTGRSHGLLTRLDEGRRDLIDLQIRDRVDVLRIRCSTGNRKQDTGRWRPEGGHHNS